MRDATIGDERGQTDESPGNARRRFTWWPIVAVIVAALALLRMLPARLVFEEPAEFWARVPTMNPLVYVLEPWNGYLGVWARAAFLVAYPFGEFGPLVTRILSAGVIAALAGFLVSDVAAPAIPSRAVRAAVALFLPLLPTAYPGPYVGPLNSQWWIALFVLLLALLPARRWHSPILVLAGLTGMAPCLVWPVFRDRRSVALLIPSAIQAAVLVASARRPVGKFGIAPDALILGLAVTLAMVTARLPLRTRLGVLYLSVAILVLGSLLQGGAHGQNRYMAVAWVGLGLGVASWVVGPLGAFATRSLLAAASILGVRRRSRIR